MSEDEPTVLVVGPPGQLTTACAVKCISNSSSLAEQLNIHPANISMSATPTLYFTAKALSEFIVATKGVFSGRESSSAKRAKDPSHPPRVYY